MNNTPVVILLTPVMTLVWPSSVGVTPSRMLIPLSYAAIMGGTLTLVGTSTNILMSGRCHGCGRAAADHCFEMTPARLC